MTVARQALGRSGEDRTARWYEAQGYTVVDRNWRCRDGELDLVVRKGRWVVFCEVKTRSTLDFGHPAEAVGWRKQRKVRHLGARWLDEHCVRTDRVRFDVAAVLPDRVDVIEGAF
jgi:putative endonuclease